MQRISILNWCFNQLTIRHNLPQKCTAFVTFNRNYGRVWTELEVERRKFVEYLKKLLPVTSKEGEEIFHAVPALRTNNQLPFIGPNIEFMLSNHITRQSIIENPFLLAMKRDIIEKKLEIIGTMGPADINDFIPLFELPLPQLVDVADHANEEYETVPQGHRIYFFCNRLNVDAQTMAKLFVKHDFMFACPFAALRKKLRILLDYNVNTSQLMQCFYIFALAEKRIIERLEQFISMGISDIQLVTFKLTDEDFQKYFRSHWNLCDGPINGDTYRTISAMEKSSSSPPLIYAEKKRILNGIHDMLPCSMEEGALIYYNFINYWDEVEMARHIVAFLKDSRIDERSIIDNPFLLKMNIGDIKDRLLILQEIKPRDIADFVPLLKIKTKTLANIAKQSKADHTNRIYYFSEKLQVQPCLVADAFADYVDIFFDQFDLLASKLDIFLAYNITAQDILSCLRALQRSAEVITNKLNLLSANKNEPIGPWMMCVDEDRFNRIVEKRTETTKTLDDCKDAREYLIKRMAWNEEDMAKIQLIYPFLFKVSILKLSKMIDFLLNEAAYTTVDIRSQIPIFNRSLSEMRCRFHECKSLNHDPKISLLCFSRKAYLNRVKKLCRDRNDGMAIFESVENRLRERKKPSENVN